jgi:response regulator of citrate/malate metabolism
MSTGKLYDSSAWLYKRFVDERKSMEEIAKEAGCSKITIRRRLNDFGIKR